VTVTLPGSEFQAALDWAVEQSDRQQILKVGDVSYRPWRVSADVDSELQRLAVPPLSVAAKLEGGVAPLVSGNCH
jgi:hypothetical protein